MSNPINSSPLDPEGQQLAPHSKHSDYGVEILRTMWGAWYWNPDEKTDAHRFIYYVPRDRRRANLQKPVKAHDRTVARAMRLAASAEVARVIKTDPARPAQQQHLDRRKADFEKYRAIGEHILPEVYRIFNESNVGFLNSAALGELIREKFGDDDWAKETSPMYTVRKVHEALMRVGLESKKGEGVMRRFKGYYREDVFRAYAELKSAD